MCVEENLRTSGDSNISSKSSHLPRQFKLIYRIRGRDARTPKKTLTLFSHRQSGPNNGIHWRANYLKSQLHSHFNS